MISNYKYKPHYFFATTFIVTFLLWFFGAYISFYSENKGLYMMLMLPGLMAPFLISLVMILLSENKAIKRDFFNRLINPRLIQRKTLPILLLLMPLSVLFSIVLSLPFGGSLYQFQFAEGFSFSSGFVPVLLILLLAASFEELGWRGYAFDSLQSRYSYFTASLLFSILWSFWHFPLLFVNNSYQYEIFHENAWFAVNFFVSIIPMGIILSWICIKNRKSILAAILFHFIINISQEILDISQMTKCIETVVLAGVAAGIIYFDRNMFFSTEHLKPKRTTIRNLSNDSISTELGRA
ncbi:MmRce1 family CPBP family CAAX prenyl protease [Desulfopila sp. IMCC35008]|uniref:MmRce1 family CPBP family CAAX prenyl protease n=1 Tax=Desulfopila sp. IMCC35008 TaxID=2653858 RepID=UPI0013D4AC34|nr:MmRce1 family CPBP family CAAX prenyl protease [Desulfopila sp. IMCC35008]